MNKGLEALKEIKNNLRLFGFDEDTDNFKLLNIIEKELKEYEEMKAIKGTTTLDNALEQTLINSCPSVAKKLKVLDIINKKNVDILRIKITQSVEKYNERKIKGCRNLTQEEYDLLKEALL